MSHWVVDRAIGETRAALIEDGSIAALRVRRDGTQTAYWGETFAARVTRVDRRRRGAYLDLGLGQNALGFLPLGAHAPPQEGAALVVKVAREAVRAKNCVVAVLPDAHPGGAPQRLSAGEAEADLANASAATPDQAAALDAAIDAALTPRLSLPDGGALIIEPTAALVAIDVDAGARGGQTDPDAFAADLNLAALHEAARQIRLRGLGGLMAIDFVSMRGVARRRALEAAAKETFRGDAWGVSVAELSRFGVMELARAQREAPLHEVLCDAPGVPSAQTIALGALRRIEREALHWPGRRLVAALSQEAHQWLEHAPLDWRMALSQRIGHRFSITADSKARRDRVDVAPA
jgi:Ribonuclease G/E